MSASDNIPASWISVRVSDIGRTVTGNTPTTKNPANYGEYIPFVKPPELTDRSITSAKDNLSQKGSETGRVLPPNSILVSCIGNLGKTGINKVP
ncbi:restriction endonuclease subunit S, partial [Arthrospira platensis SPKY1]|nr:restriction endonuclease subunit S [Arthrospira platensis SPKY1]